MSINLGATVETTFTTTPAETGTLVVTAPDGTVTNPAVTGSAGSQAALFEATQIGTWTATWTSPNAGETVETFTVGPAVVSLEQIKAALNKTDSSDDDELQRLIDAALAEYAAHVRPLPGTQTVRVGGSSVSVLPLGTTALLSGTLSGQAVDVTSLELDTANGLLYGPVTAGTVLTVTTGGVPANHVEAIIADVAGLFAGTQRAGGPGPRFPGEGFAEPLDVQPGRPVTLFPRIRALAALSVA